MYIRVTRCRLFYCSSVDHTTFSARVLTILFALLAHASLHAMRDVQAVVDYSPYDKRCQGEKASAADLWACQTASGKSHRPLLEGLYASQITRWQRAFDESQVRRATCACMVYTLKYVC